jgi:uncharacterized protein (TIGR02118 family)
MTLALTFCLRRLPSLSLEEFQRYWIEHHAPLVRSHLPALRAVRYAQWHALPQDPATLGLARVRQAPEPFDGMAQLWWDSREAFDASMKEPAARDAGRILLEDERRFIDLARSPIWINRGHVFDADGV